MIFNVLERAERQGLQKLYSSNFFESETIHVNVQTF